LLWIGVIYLASTGSGTLPTPPLFAHADKLGHFILYLPLGFFFVRAWPVTGARFSLNRIVIIAALFAGGFGLLMEFIQLHVPGRSFEWMDNLADALGALLGAAVCVYYKNLQG
jgi:VanZ family protein